MKSAEAVRGMLEALTAAHGTAARLAELRAAVPPV